ncbi:hypothetical protein HAX54_000478 [Datura stramonium]|uniref:Glucuronosyltransferase PGSIP8 n=1 Tax=Datura stramonium TaxID=4076 RepID=A0ABS8T271_DATST|nr:hypothetical protein [Datura stramonium]
MIGGLKLLFLWVFSVLIIASTAAFSGVPATPERKGVHRNAYATMMYMGTPRDYEFYVATRVMLRSLSRLGVDADLVVIASLDVPLHWVQTLNVHELFYSRKCSFFSFVPFTTFCGHIFNAKSLL